MLCGLQKTKQQTTKSKTTKTCLMKIGYDCCTQINFREGYIEQLKGRPGSSEQSFKGILLPLKTLGRGTCTRKENPGRLQR